MITMMIKCAAILALFFLQTTHQKGESSCKVSLFRFGEFMVFDADTLEIVYPSLQNAPDDRNLTISPGKSILLSCKGGRFENQASVKTILTTCNQNFQFEVQDTILEVNSLYCSNFNPVVARITSIKCAPQAFFIEIGFELGLNIKFLPQIIVCFDAANLNPLYSNYNLTKAIGFIKSYLTTKYLIDSVYNSVPNIDFDQLYNNFTYQQISINKLLGLEEESTKYVDPHSCSPYPPTLVPGFCFSMRPLAYRGNFVYVPQHSATYRYVNVAPQWYFLNYNLDKLERNVIDYVKGNAIDLDVYNGNYGIATFPHESTGESVELFLHVSGNVKAIPVPWIFWKLIYDRLTLRATVFLTVNNPHLTDVSKGVICEDVSDQITWLTWEKHNATKGYSYACSYQDAKNVITYLPDIEVKNLLI